MQSLVSVCSSERMDHLHEPIGTRPGPVSSLKTQDGPAFRSEWAPFRGPRDRNLDAGPSRDLNFELLSWFEPHFLEESKNIKV